MSLLSPAAVPPLPSLTNTYGALLLSTFVALGLYGITMNQTFRYYRSYPEDVTFLKVLVFVIFLADTFHSITLMHLCYHYLVQSYFNPLNLLRGEWPIQLMSASTGVVVLLAQIFYTRRIFLANRRYRWVVFGIGLLILAELAFMIAATYYALRSVTFAAFAPYLWLDSALFCMATVTDLVLMVVSVIILRTSQTSFRGTRSALDQLSLYAVIATLLNTALTLPAFISSLTSRTTFIYIAMAIPTTKIYTNSVLGILNCRTALAQSIGAASGSTSYSLSNLKRSCPTASRDAAGPQQESHMQGSDSVVKAVGRFANPDRGPEQEVIIISGQSSQAGMDKALARSYELHRMDV